MGKTHDMEWTGANAWRYKYYVVGEYNEDWGDWIGYDASGEAYPLEDMRFHLITNYADAIAIAIAKNGTVRSYDATQD